MIDPAPGYARAKQLVLAAGFAEDVVWAESLARVVPDPVYVWRETAWVIVNSGFRFAVARKLWPGLLAAFHDFDPARLEDGCRARALAVLNYPRKIDAIVAVGQEVRLGGAPAIVADAAAPARLRRLPFIGGITCFHLAKVLGADVVKPDVHLLRASVAAGFPSPLALCEAVRAATGDRLAVVDSVLWRYGEQRERRRWAAWPQLWATSP